MRITNQQRQQNEQRIRAAMDRLLQGDIPNNGNCDIKTLAAQANVDRTAFYGSRPYAHLREEFEARLETISAAGDIPDARVAQITRLKQEVEHLKQRLSTHEQTIAELIGFKTLALSQIAAQHDEIIRLRASAAANSHVRRLPTRPAATIGPCN